jgi:hypothetical protein
LEALVGADVLWNETTSEYRAFEWLTSEDQSGILENPRTPVWKLEHQYIVANFYFATNGYGWVNQLHFLSDSDDCDWLKRDVPYRPPASFGNGRNTTVAGITSCDSEGRITALRLPQNNLTNTIPTMISQLTTLQDLDLLENRLSAGALPSKLGLLTGLRTLTLAGNDFLPSPILDSLISLTNLGILWMSQASMTGTIPIELVLLTNLQALGISDIFLSGTLPTELGQMTKLDTIIFGANLLVGTLPVEYKAWSNLKRAYFEVSVLSTSTLPAE